MASEGRFCCALAVVFDDHVVRIFGTCFFGRGFLLPCHGHPVASKTVCEGAHPPFSSFLFTVILVIKLTHSFIANNTCFVVVLLMGSTSVSASAALADMRRH
jgi:hypothetical protein